MNRRWFGLAAFDLAVAAVVGLLIVSLFGVAGQEDSRPPVCTNRFGATIDCGQGHWVSLVARVAFGVVLLGLWAFHGRRALGFRHDGTA